MVAPESRSTSTTSKGPGPWSSASPAELYIPHQSGCNGPRSTRTPIDRRMAPTSRDRGTRSARRLDTCAATAPRSSCRTHHQASHPGSGTAGHTISGPSSRGAPSPRAAAPYLAPARPTPPPVRRRTPRHAHPDPTSTAPPPPEPHRCAQLCRTPTRRASLPRRRSRPPKPTRIVVEQRIEPDEHVAGQMGSDHLRRQRQVASRPPIHPLAPPPRHRGHPTTRAGAAVVPMDGIDVTAGLEAVTVQRKLVSHRRSHRDHARAHRHRQLLRRRDSALTLQIKQPGQPRVLSTQSRQLMAKLR